MRGEGSILDAIKQPDLAAELTLQPVRRYGVDAAVLYSDIVVPAHAVGFGIDVAPGTGPGVRRPRSVPQPTSAACGRSIRRPTRRTCFETVDILAAELPESVPLARLRRCARSPWPATSSRVGRAERTSTPNG